MLKFRDLSALTVLFLISFQVTAFADGVQGRLARMDPKTLDMTVYDAQGKPYPNTLHLKVDQKTQINGLAYGAVLRNGDFISADVRQESAGVWRADRIKFLGRTQTAKSAPPSPSLMNALTSPTGQKVIRGGITGAITGAVASGASGGKAGKGALIGAGVGAAGGLLEGLFSQPSSSQSSSTTVTTQEDTRR